MFADIWGIIEVAGLTVGLGVILVILGRIVRRVNLIRRARSPVVQITPFSWAAGEGDQEALWITSLFRAHLKALQLDGLDPVPDRAPGAPLVEIVEGVGQGVGRGVEWSKVMGRLYRAVVPDYAYEVWATLRPQGEGVGSISIQLVKRGSGNKTLASFTTETGDWDTRARQAAIAAAGALYPHVATRYKGPWVDWKEPVPPDLLGPYQSALQYEQSGQFEQALGGFREAVEKDPLNPQLRLKAAMVEERLGLHLDAWFTYWAIVAESNRMLWKGPHRRTRLVALYRLAIHLWNPDVAKQWTGQCEPTSGKKYKTELDRLRTELRSALARERVFKEKGCRAVKDGAAKATASELMGSLAAELEADDRRELLDIFNEAGHSAVHTAKIAEMLQIIGLNRLEELTERMSRRRTRAGRCWPDRRSRRPPLRRWPAPKELPPLAVEASELLVRTLLAQKIETRNANRWDGAPPRMARGHERLLRRWPLPGWNKEGSGAVLRLIRVWLGNRRRDAWQLHYNAACAIATQFSKRSMRCEPTKAMKKRWCEAAVEELELFSYYAGSGRVASMADWIAFEDPDLADLYSDSEFKLWGAQRFGFALPEVRPSGKADVNRHTVLILKRTAAALESVWRGRAATGTVPPRVLLGWWKEELKIWEELEELCREHQSWRCRHEAFKVLDRWQAVNQPATVDLAHEKREDRITAGSIPRDLLDGLRVAMGSRDGGEDAPMGWVSVRVEEVTTAHHWDQCASPTEVVALPQAERRAAIEAATVWASLGAALETALRTCEEPDWSALSRPAAT